MASVTSTRSMTVGRLRDALSTIRLVHVAGPVPDRRIVSSVTFYDSGDAVAVDSVVLGVGIRVDDDLARVARELAAGSPSVVVVRGAIAADHAFLEAANRVDLPVLGLVTDVPWHETTAAIAGAFQTTIVPDLRDGVADLFEAANSFASLLGAPVTIEDLSSRVVAFSSDQTNTDEPRRLILGMHVPADLHEIHQRQGAYREVYASDRPVTIDPPVEGAYPRVAIRVRAGEELLGSIWAVVREPLTPTQEESMMQAAEVLGSVMLRSRIMSEATRRIRVSFLATLLEGGARARDAARQLDLRPGRFAVIVVGRRHALDGDHLLAEAETQRLASAFSIYLQTSTPRAVTAPLGTRAYAVVPLHRDSDDPERTALRVAEGFVSRVDSGAELVAGVGRVVSDVAQLPLSRRDADDALRVLLARPSLSTRAAGYDSVQVEALMLRISDSLADDDVTLRGPLAAIRAYDLEHRSDLEATLRLWLDRLGDVSSAASTMHLHPTTLRYRLKRIAEVTGVDLDDAETRFGLMLQSRLFPALESHPEPPRT